MIRRDSNSEVNTAAFVEGNTKYDISSEYKILQSFVDYHELSKQENSYLKLWVSVSTRKKLGKNLTNAENILPSRMATFKVFSKHGGRHPKFEFLDALWRSVAGPRIQTELSYNNIARLFDHSADQAWHAGNEMTQAKERDSSSECTKKTHNNLWAKESDGEKWDAWNLTEYWDGMLIDKVVVWFFQNLDSFDLIHYCHTTICMG